MARSHAEKARRRAERLESLRSPDSRWDDEADARYARRQLWEVGKPSEVRVRLDLIVRPTQRPSPLQEICGPRGIALQLLLLLIFEAQCRKRGFSAPSTFPLRESTDPNTPAWRALIAAPTFTEEGVRPTSRFPVDAKVEQIKNGLDRLARADRIELAAYSGRRRFDHVKLLHEAADNHRATPTAYSRPSSPERFIAVPIEFFLEGWVHALEENEIISYLLLLWEWQNARSEDREAGVFMSRKTWALAFGPRGRGHEAYRLLSRCGLIGIDRDPRRRANGTIKDHNNEDVDTTTITLPHRFFVHGADALAHPAGVIVATALRGIVEGIDIDDAYLWAASGFDRMQALMAGARALPGR